MAKNSLVQWVNQILPNGTVIKGHTINLWWGCTHVHEGCTNCYAETFSNKMKVAKWGHNEPRVEVLSAFSDLAKFQKNAKALNQRQIVFCGSMMDIFEKPMHVIRKGESMPYTTHYLREKLFTQISKGEYDNLFFLFLTKRPSNINKYIPQSWLAGAPENVMFGTSVSSQEDEQLILQLLEVKGNTFLSLEPLLGEIDLRKVGKDELGLSADVLAGTWEGNGDGYPKIDWVIAGGESGDKARPMHPDWARKLRQDCAETGTPLFFKQWGEYLPVCQWHSELSPFLEASGILAWHNGNAINTYKLGKHASGNSLDGKIHMEFPKVITKANGY